VAKTEIYLIRCEIANLSYLTTFGMIISNFPCKYLGLPLHYKKPTKQMMQPIIQRIIDKHPGWKRRFLSYPGRELLVKTVLSTMPTFFLTLHKMHIWAYATIDRYKMSFIWKGTDPDRIRGGHNLVNWKTCLMPMKGAFM
jgi:hypothetical protein